MPARPMHPTRTRRRAVLAAPLLILALAGCSGSGDDTGGDTTAATTGDRSTTATSTAATSTTAPAVEVDQTPPVGANGIKIADDDTVWIASLGSDAILRVDTTTGRIVARIDAPAGSGPDDVALAPDGTLYWTGFLSGDVGVVDAGGDRTEVLANVGSGANPIALRADGSLVVGRAGAATGLFSVDPSSNAPPVPLADPGNLNSFDIAPNGLLYAPSVNTASVVEVDSATGETIRTVATVLGVPIAVRWHDDELFALVLSDSTRVVRIDPTTGATEVVADTGLPVADNLAVGDDGRIYVTGLNAPTITVVGPDGQVERTVRVGG